MPLNPPVRLAQHAGHRVVTGPAAEPVTLAEMQALLRNPPSDENAFISLCITEARAVFETITNIACINQTWKLTLDRWPGGPEPWWDGTRELPVTELYTQRGAPRHVLLPKYPLSSVSSVTTYDTADASTSVTVNNVFFTDTASYPGRLCLRSGQVWPIALRDHNSIEIQYVAGFGSAESDVPAVLKRAIQQMAAYLYDNRGTGCSPEAIITGSGALQIAAEYVTVRI